ncbi:hypothetical protein CMI45_03395 [Candidatus Pacearchaeota archaeon]|nr:hypothetical protein [Candidatus Pacearchaeota archaeon]|tara:strand:+ start:2250 stop:2954 length:705 start_codon:yes stop_codon:yes gene_type:complete
MPNPKQIARRFRELSDEDRQMTPKRVKTLRNILNTIQGIVEINTRMGSDNPRFRAEDYEDIGQMDYLLREFFPRGDIPIELEPYANFVNRIRGIDHYHSVLEAKLQRDSEYLSRSDKSVDEIDDPVYQRLIINVVDADKVKPEETRIVIKYEGERLYEENVPDIAFQGLPKGSTILFDYTDQGLNIDLKETLSNCKGTEVSRIERVVIDSLASDVSSRKYIDSLYDQINEELEG